MRSLLIKVYDDNHKVIEKIVSQRLDVCGSTTVISRALIVGKEYKQGFTGNDFHIPYKIDHWNIFEGLITIYYKNGYELEISRLNND